MAKEEWHEAYKDRLKITYYLSDVLAKDVLSAGMDDIDYEDDPADAADEEMSYWGD